MSDALIEQVVIAYPLGGGLLLVIWWLLRMKLGKNGHMSAVPDRIKEVEVRCSHLEEGQQEIRTLLQDHMARSEDSDRRLHERINQFYGES